MTDVRCDVDGPVATVTLNRPERRNAISGSLLSQLRATMAELDARPDVRVIVLTGVDPAFCAGLDLTELGQAGSPLSPGGVWSGAPAPQQAADWRRERRCDHRRSRTRLGLRLPDRLGAGEVRRQHARMGIMPGWGLTAALPAAVGLRRARQMSATGNFVDAVTALTWGLVNHVVPHAELMSFTARLAADAASNDPAAVQAIFATYREVSQVPGADAAAVERRAHERWHAGGIDRDEVARRRSAVIERGRTQSG
jgi:enoyl-CoA hydratase